MRDTWFADSTTVPMRRSLTLFQNRNCTQFKVKNNELSKQRCRSVQWVREEHRTFKRFTYKSYWIQRILEIIRVDVPTETHVLLKIDNPMQLIGKDENFEFFIHSQFVIQILACKFSPKIGHSQLRSKCINIKSQQILHETTKFIQNREKCQALGTKTKC